MTQKEKFTMKKVFLLSGLITFSLLVLATSYVHAADKIGFVNVREVVMRSDAGKAMETEFRKSVDEKRVVIQKKESDLKKLKDNLEKQRSVLTPQAMQEKEMNYQVEFREYERLVKDSNEELQAKEQLLTNKVIPEVIKTIRVIGDREKYTVILEENSAIFSSKENSLTEKVIKELNKEYKGK